MRVTSIDIVSANSSNNCLLSFRDPTSQNPYQVKGITGLDADNIVPRYYGNAGGSGDKYYALSLQKRDIVVKIGLNPRFGQDESYSGLRDELYKLISASRTGALRLDFKDGVTTIASVSGIVSKLETDQFSRSPEATLTISCDDPMLRGSSEVIVDVSELVAQSTIITDGLSTAPHGLKFEVTFTEDVDDFIINDSTEQWAFAINFGWLAGFNVGDKLTFSNEHNQKTLYLTRAGVQHNFANLVALGSVWPVIFPGDNEIFCSPGVVWDSISYYPTYWGV